MPRRARTWIERAVALTAVATLAFAAGAPRAEAAGTSTNPFTVTTKISGVCVMSATSLTFPNYTSGGGARTSASVVTVSCPGAGPPPDNVPAQFRLTPTNGVVTAFRMFSGANTMNYTLSTGGVNYVPNVDLPGGFDFAADLVPITVDGTIAAGLSPPVGSYSQTIRATLTY